MSLAQPIKLTGELEVHEVLEALRLERQPVSVSQRIGIGIGVLFVGFLVYIALDSFRFDGRAGVRILLTITLVTSVCAVSVLRRRFLLHRSLQQDKQKGVGHFSSPDTTISEEGIIVVLPGIEQKLEWSAFVGAKSSPQVVLFMLATGGYVFVGRSRFPDAQSWEAFVEFVVERFPNKTKK